MKCLPALLLVLALAAPVGAADVSLLAGAEWLQERLGAPELRIVDMSSDVRTYRRGHIPGAIYLNVEDARVPVPAGGYRLPSPEEAARLFARLGLGPDTSVVIYDDAGGLHAARLFFTLEAYGRRNVTILDGGSQRWRALGGAWTREVPRLRTPTALPAPTLQAERVAGADWIRERLGRADVALVDARTPEEYSGRDARARRGGHIPGAVHVEWTRHLRPDGTFRPLPELRAMYLEAGVTPGKTVITYCQTQHRASHSYFVLRLLGYPNVVAYDRSWIEWGNRDDLPIARR